MEISKNFVEFINKNPHISFISNLNKTIEKMGLTMVYEGKIDQEIIKIISKSVEAKLNDEESNVKIKRLIFHIAIELLQNISKYSDDHTKGKGVIIIGKAPEGYYISSGNNIKNDKIDKIKNWINYLNELTKEELSELYHKNIKENEFNAKSGAGLGLIDIIRKTKQKIIFNFETLSSETSFFLVTVSIIKE